MRKLLLCFVLSVTLASAVAVPAAGAAASTLPMQQLHLSIWPEYDEPEVLVIYNGVLVNDTAQPFQGEIRYHVPADARVNMVGELEKGMIYQPYDDVTTPEGRQVVWRPSRELAPGETFPVMFEYYFNPLSGAGPRDIRVDLELPFAVQNLVVSVQEPLRASNFVLDPRPQGTSSEEVGGRQFTTHRYTFQDVPPGRKLSFNIKYEKPDATPSVPANTQAAAAPPAQETPSSGSQASTLVVVVAALVVVLAAFFFLALRNNRPAAGSRTGPGAAARRDRAGREQASGKAPRSRSAGDERQRGGGRAEEIAREKRRLRKMLLDGKISEETYKELVRDLEHER